MTIVNKANSFVKLLCWWQWGNCPRSLVIFCWYDTLFFGLLWSSPLRSWPDNRANEHPSYLHDYTSQVHSTVTVAQSAVHYVSLAKRSGIRIPRVGFAPALENTHLYMGLHPLPPFLWASCQRGTWTVVATPPRSRRGTSGIQTQMSRRNPTESRCLQAATPDCTLNWI